MGIQRGGQPVRSIAGLVVALALLGGCGTAGPTPSASVSTAPSASSRQAPTPSELATSVVQVLVVVDGEVYAWGSGTLISADGLILTNAHVVAPDGPVAERLEIALTDATDQPPERAYRAEVVLADAALDLAIVRITETLDGDEVDATFPFVELGDSDALDIGAGLRILGYPGIGGETITFTSGEVSGFVGEAGLGHRAWVKTDATIAGGNSGGLAADEEGRLVAVPTVVGAGTGGEVVDCRAIRDTNHDGLIDGADDCVPLGGFINGLRPIALARPMIDAALAGTAYEPIADLPTDEPSDGPGPAADWEGPIFSSGVTDDGEPLDELLVLPSGSERACAFWDYDGMEDGVRWSAVWSVDGEASEDLSLVDRRWSLGPRGSLWVCADDPVGLPDAVYDIALTVEDEFVTGGFVHVGDHDLATVRFENAGEDTVCYLYLSPTVSGLWGPDRLGVSDTLEPGESLEVEVATATYSVLAQSCARQDMFEQVLLEVTGDESVSIGSSGTGVIDANTLDEGDCFNTFEEQFDEVEVVECRDPHVFEAFLNVEHPAGQDEPFPGDADLRGDTQTACRGAFEEYVGLDYDASVWYFTGIRPSAATWAAGDRIIICALHLEDRSEVTGSARGSRR